MFDNENWNSIDKLGVMKIFILLQPYNPSGSVAIEDLRNYNKLESNIREMLQTILERGDPVAAKAEIRYLFVYDELCAILSVCMCMCVCVWVWVGGDYTVYSLTIQHSIIL